MFGRGFDTFFPLNSLRMLAKSRPENPRVGGSIPPLGTKILKNPIYFNNLKQKLSRLYKLGHHHFDIFWNNGSGCDFLVATEATAGKSVLAQQRQLVPPPAKLTRADSSSSLTGLVRHALFARSQQGFALELGTVAFVSLRFRHKTPPDAHRVSFQVSTKQRKTRWPIPVIGADVI